MEFDKHVFNFIKVSTPHGGLATKENPGLLKELLEFQLHTVD